MKILSDFLRLFGFNVELGDSSSPIFVFACCVLVLNIVGLLCFINVLIYFGAIYIIDHKVFLDKISKYPYLLKFVYYYRNLRVSFLIFDVIFFFLSIGIVIWLCSRLVLYM